MSTIPERFEYIVYYGDQPNVCINSPDDWLKTTVEINKSDSYGGLIRSLTLPYTFVEDTATLLRQIYYSQGQPLARFYINKQNRITWEYNRLFTGKIDFSSKKDTLTGFEVSAIEDNITSKLDAYDDTNFSLPLTGDDVVTATLTPLILKEKADFIFLPSTDFRSDSFFALQVVNNTQLSTQASVKQAGFLAQTNPDFNTSDQWFYIARADGNVPITGHIQGRSNGPGEFEMNFYKSNGTSLGELVKTIYSVIHTDSSHIDFDFDFNLNPNMIEGERLYCYFRNVISGNTNVGFQVDKGNISMTYNTKSPSSTCKGLMAKDVYKRIMVELDPTTPIQSTMLSGEFSRLFYTCSNAILTTQVGNVYNTGDDLQIGGTYLVYGAAITYVDMAGISQVYNIGEYFTAIPGYDQFTSVDGGIAQLVLEIPSIQISFKSFFQDMYGLKCGQVAFGLDNGIACLEDLAYFARSIKTLDLGSNISGWESTPNLKRRYTKITIGYEDKQYNALNGSQEAMSTQEYITPYENNKVELNAKCVSNAAPFAIEEKRVILPNVNGNTAASRSDNDNYMIMLHPTENRPYTVTDGCANYSGVDGSYYNWQISPKRNMLRGSRFLASCLDRLGGNITFKSGDKNTAMTTTDLNGVTISERSNLVISSLGVKIFRPEIFTFTCAQDSSTGLALMSRPYGYISHVFVGIALKGFIQSVLTDEGENTAQKFTLECCGDVDLTKLIR